MTRSFLPVSRPSITPRDIDEVPGALNECNRSRTGENLQTAVEQLKQFTDGHDVLLTTSCTVAIEMALRALGIGPGGEVLLPSFTSVATAHAVLDCGARPIFLEIEERTLNLNPSLIERHCTAETRAIIPVHYNSLSCELDELLSAASARGLHVIEDAAHALGATYKGKALGSLGDFGCYSFDDTETFAAAGGGALVLNNPEYRSAAESVYEEGSVRAAFRPEEVDGYAWVSQGGTFGMTGVIGARLRKQLERRQEMLSAREMIMRRYNEGLAALVAERLIRFVETPSYNTPHPHMACSW